MTTIHHQGIGIVIPGAVRSREALGLSTAEIARHLGVTTSSITRAIEKMVEGTG
jgi:transposase